MKKSIFFLLSIAAILQAADDALPALTAEQQRDYLTAQIAYDRAIAAFESGLTAAQKTIVQEFGNANQALAQQQQTLAALCGDKQQVTVNRAGVPSCIAKPPVEKK